MLNCDEQTTLDDFGSGILVKEESEDYFNNNTNKLKNEVSWIDSILNAP